MASPSGSDTVARTSGMRSRSRASRSRRSLVASTLCLAWVIGCSRSQGRPNDKDRQPMSVQVTCSQVVQEGKPTVRYAIKNTGTAVVHLLDGGRMPYLLRAKDGALIVLHGVNAPDPDTDYHMV